MMADENEVVPVAADAEAKVEVKATPEKTRKGTAAKKPDGAVARKTAKPEKEKSPKFDTKQNTVAHAAGQIAEIEKLAAQGSSMKDAFEKVGVSKQSYYRWKRLAGPEQKPNSALVAKQSTTPPASTQDSFGDLMELEAENERLRKLLSEKLRSENADLRKRLGTA